MEGTKGKQGKLDWVWVAKSLGFWVSGFLDFFRGDGVDPGGLCTPGLALRDF